MQQASLFAAPPPRVEPSPSRSPEPFSRLDDRRRAWGAWTAEGKPWPPPAGLLSACLSACTATPQPRRFR